MLANRRRMTVLGTLIVVSIIGVPTSIMAIGGNRIMQRSRVSAANAPLSGFATALESIAADTESPNQYSESFSPNGQPGHLLRSYGRDSASGSDGYDADIIFDNILVAVVRGDDDDDDDAGDDDDDAGDDDDDAGDDDDDAGDDDDDAGDDDDDAGDDDDDDDAGDDDDDDDAGDDDDDDDAGDDDDDDDN